jgi:hypothetical protein
MSGPTARQQLVEPDGDLLAVDRAVQGQGDPLHPVVVDVALVVMTVVVVTAVLVMHVAMVVVMMVVAAMLVVHMAGLAVGRVEEFRLQLGDPLQVEAVLAR